jgi:hypothetical protein
MRAGAAALLGAALGCTNPVDLAAIPGGGGAGGAIEGGAGGGAGGSAPMPDPAADVVASRCPAVAGERAWCLMGQEDVLVALGLETGDTCFVAPATLVGQAQESDAVAIAVIGRLVHYCRFGESEADSVLARVDLETQTLEQTQLDCNQVTAWEDGLLVRPYSLGPMKKYPSFEAVQQGLAGTVLDVADGNDGPFLVHDGVLLSTWHSANSIDRRAMPSGDELPPIALEAESERIRGLHVLAGGGIVVHDGAFTVRLFEADGSHRTTLTVGPEMSALHCWGTLP